MITINHLALTTDHIAPSMRHVAAEEINLSHIRAGLTDLIECAEVVTLTHQGRISTLKNRNGPLSR